MIRGGSAPVAEENRMHRKDILFHIVLETVGRPLLLLLLRRLIIGLRLWLVIGMAEGDATAALPEEQVQQRAKHNPGRQQPDNSQPEDLARGGMIVFQHHQRGKNVSKNRDENNHKKQYCIEKTTSVARHNRAPSLFFTRC